MTQKTKSDTPKAASPRAAGKTSSRTVSKRTTKKAQLIQMLGRKAGADVATISKKFGWLPHTTRAALTGLRKSGFEITSEKPGEGRLLRYRITAKPAADAA